MVFGELHNQSPIENLQLVEPAESLGETWWGVNTVLWTDWYTNNMKSGDGAQTFAAILSLLNVARAACFCRDTRVCSGWGWSRNDFKGRLGSERHLQNDPSWRRPWLTLLRNTSGGPPSPPGWAQLGGAEPGEFCCRYFGPQHHSSPFSCVGQKVS